jgi:hypothetical protein
VSWGNFIWLSTGTLESLTPTQWQGAAPEVTRLPSLQSCCMWDSERCPDGSIRRWMVLKGKTMGWDFAQISMSIMTPPPPAQSYSGWSRYLSPYLKKCNRSPKIGSNIQWEERGCANIYIVLTPHSNAYILIMRIDYVSLMGISGKTRITIFIEIW